MWKIGLATALCTALVGCETIESSSSGEITDPQFEEDTAAGRDLDSRHNADGHHHHDHNHDDDNHHNHDGHHHHSHHH